ncbi:MAG: helix-turn-helix domain-containing protein [Paracoccus sp. (in: a-proteobacteria)]|uniref:helix-turn-helix transcriptional regulator n=1 Tax=Paracoccus sp. TaxID=267 RepID=UPI0026E0A3CA|nr:helix-turn-helix domain-containing protein [Paracoccus sp. (in: a-proteobacteria)]MDO5623032.1 helix-turn-helix domain-containing protein [Paracoccus sp. (in: a-proteobacteria)]
MTDGIQPNDDQTDILRDWMSRAELAQTLGLTSDTLARWETRRIGPPCVRIGRKIIYRRAAVQSWLLDQETRKAGPRGRGGR